MIFRSFFFPTLGIIFSSLYNSVCTAIQNRKKQIIIYCRRFDDCADLYLFFRDQLGADFTEPPSSPDLPRFRRVDMFLSCTDPVVKEEIIQSFT